MGLESRTNAPRDRAQRPVRESRAARPPQPSRSSNRRPTIRRGAVGERDGPTCCEAAFAARYAERPMEGTDQKDANYYRCRFAASRGLGAAEATGHPRSLQIKEDALLQALFSFMDRRLLSRPHPQDRRPRRTRRDPRGLRDHHHLRQDQPNPLDHRHDQPGNLNRHKQNSIGAKAVEDRSNSRRSTRPSTPGEAANRRGSRTPQLMVTTTHADAPTRAGPKRRLYRAKQRALLRQQFGPHPLLREPLSIYEHGSRGVRTSSSSQGVSLRTR